MKRSSLAWIGSANFTRCGFADNEELLLETRSNDRLQAWFDKRWESVAKDASKRLREYCDEWERPNPMRGVDSRPEGKIAFEQDGERPPPKDRGGIRHQSPTGHVIVDGKRFRYQSAQEAIIIVLEALQRRDGTFYERCLEHEGFHREGRRNHFIARTQRSLGTPHNRKSAQKMESGWWISKQTQTQEKWTVIEAAAEVAGLQLVGPRQMWRAETQARIKVGF